MNLIMICPRWNTRLACRRKLRLCQFKVREIKISRPALGGLKGVQRLNKINRQQSAVSMHCTYQKQALFNTLNLSLVYAFGFAHNG